MKIALYAVFFALSAVHLYACYFHIIRLRYITKPFLMPVLALLYLVSAGSFSAVVFAAVLFGMLGDIFLLFRRRKAFFGAGLAAFAVGHVLYLTVLIPPSLAVSQPVWLYALMALPFLAGVAACCVRRMPFAPKLFHPAMLIYALLLASMGFFTLALMLSARTTAAVLLFTGALCFIGSDTILALSIFKYKERVKANFAVMLTYIAAQFLLISGFIQL